jgi:hypothetical protein
MPNECYQFLADDTFEFSKTREALTPLILKVVQREIEGESHQGVLQD